MALPAQWIMLLLCLLQTVPSRANFRLDKYPSEVTVLALRLVSETAAQSTCRAASSKVEELFRLGQQALQSGQLAVAESCFRAVTAADPGASSGHVNLAVALMREKRWNEALVELRRAQVLSPREPGVQLNIGLTYYKENNFVAAIEPLSTFLQMAPGSLQGRYLLGLCYFFTDRYKEATATLTPLWEQESLHLNYLYVLAIAASKSSDPAVQQRAFDQMLAIGQNSPEFHVYMGKAWLAEDDTAKALQEFRTAALARPDLPLVHYFLGRTYLEQHTYTQAEAELLRDIEIEPDFAYNYEDLGILYAQTDSPAKAEHYFLEAVRRNSALVNSYLGLAKLYRKSGRLQDALTQLEAAEALAPQSASLHYMKGQVLASLGNTARAHLEFQQSAALLNAFNQRIQQGATGDRSADAQDAAEQ